MFPLDNIRQFFVGKMLVKAVRAGVAAFLASKAASVLAAHGVGVSVDPDALAAGVVAGAAALRNYLKVKKGWKIP